VNVVFPGPDALIKRSSDASFVGNGVFNTTDAWQTVRSRVKPGASASFRIEIQNEGVTDDSFLVKGCGSSPAFEVRYFSGSTNVTSSVVAGSYATSMLAPSARTSLSARVSVRSTAAVGTMRACLFTAGSQASPTKKDAVRFKIKVT
jgi:uncharacterized membrane protein